MTDNGGGRGSGAADSWFKPTENRHRTQSEYQDPLEEQNDDATVFPDSGGYAGLSSSRPPMVEPYPEALGGPPPAAPPSAHSISYPGASQAAFQPLTRVPGEHDENPSPDAGERGYPGVAASAQVPLPPEESGSAGDEVWGRDSWARSESRAQEPGSAAAEPQDSDAAWNAAPRADDGSPWAAPDASLNDVPGADAPWGASGGPAAAEPTWGAPDGAAPNTGTAGSGSDAGPLGRSEDSDAWNPAAPADDAPWSPSGPAPDVVPGADRGTGPGPDTVSGADALWGAPASSATSDAPWDAPDGTTPTTAASGLTEGSGAWNADTSTDDAAWGAPAPAETGGDWNPDSGPDSGPGTDAPWGGPTEVGDWSRDSGRDTDAPWGASAPVGDTASGADASWADSDQPVASDRSWDAPVGADPSLDGPAATDAGAWSPSSSDEARWGAPVSSGASDFSWEAPVGADPSLDGPVASDGWNTEQPTGEAPWDTSARADEARWGVPDGTTANTGTAGPGSDADPLGRPGDSDAWSPSSSDEARWGAPVSSGASDFSWDAPVGADPSLDGPVASDGWNTEQPTGEAPWDTSARADEARWGVPDGTTANTGTGPDDDSWNPARPEATDGWTPVPSADDAPWGDPAGPNASGTGAWSPVPGTDDPLRGARDWDHDELGSRSWGDERRSDLRDEGTEGLESWAPAREGEDAWGPSADPEPWTGDRYADELSPEAPAPGPAASGNTWAFDRDDLRLPDVVREAEQRRREAATGPEYQDWGGEPESPADPLAAIADMQSRASEQGAHGYDEPAARYDDGATQMFDAPAYDAPGHEAPAYDAPGYDAAGYDAPGYEASGYDAAGYDAPAYDAPGYEASGYEASGYDAPEYDGPRDGGATQMFDAYAEDDQGGYDEPVAQGAPSDVATQDWQEESEYDDGFTPADYGMPAQPEQRKRRKDPIADDFPGFGDRPLGGEAGDAYPGYDSIDYLADTERGAVATLWLGLASLLPGIGLITAALALVVTGPKAKRAIRGSHGQLDGLGLITAGTVLAVVGILVTVVSVLVFFLL